jgi:hypothetical protein
MLLLKRNCYPFSQIAWGLPQQQKETRNKARKCASSVSCYEFKLQTYWGRMATVTRHNSVTKARNDTKETPWNTWMPVCNLVFWGDMMKSGRAGWSGH